MTIESARRFVLKNSDAKYKGHAKHLTFLKAVEVIENFKRCKIGEWMRLPPNVVPIGHHHFQ